MFSYLSSENEISQELSFCMQYREININSPATPSVRYPLLSHTRFDQPLPIEANNCGKLFTNVTVDNLHKLH